MSKKLIDLLIKQDLLSDVQVNEIRKLSRQSNDSEENIIFNEDYIGEKELFKIISNNFNIEYADLDFIDIKKELVEIIPKEIAIKYGIIPFSVNENELHMTFINPLDYMIIDELKFFTNKNIIVYISRKEQIISAIDYYYSGNLAEKVVQQLSDEYTENLAKEKNDFYEVDKSKISPMIQLVDLIIRQAVNQRASDIHIEPFEDVLIVRIRIDGQLNKIMNLPKKIYDSLSSRIKFMANMNIAQKLKPLDGKFNLNIDGTNYDFRVSSLPTVYGEKIVIRILHKHNRLISLDLLGFSEADNKILRNIVKHSQGIILVTGPTGSGKSTTLYALLNEIDKAKKNIVTIEEPVEYNMFGINQVSVNNKSGLTFASGLRSILRQDPDVLMVGEIRDEETAQIAVRAAITGHLVLSTLHTNDAVNSIARLIDMGVPKYLVADALTAVLAQRLVRKICPYCSVKYEPSEEEKRYLGVKGKEKLFKGVGCSKCSNTGYKGRIVVFELLYLNKNHKKIITESVSIEDLREYSYKNGMSRIGDNCKELVFRGVTTYEEVLGVTYA